MKGLGKVIVLSIECYITFIGMLYYFRSNVILLLKGTQGTSRGKSRSFPNQLKEVQERTQANSQTKPRNFKKEVQSIQERNPINLQSNLNPFAREGSLLRRGSFLISFGKSFGFALGRPLFCRGITIRLGAKSLHEKY